jgi:hypothetical protein
MSKSANDLTARPSAVSNPLRRAPARMSTAAFLGKMNSAAQAPTKVDLIIQRIKKEKARETTLQLDQKINLAASKKFFDADMLFKIITLYTTHGISNKAFSLEALERMHTIAIMLENQTYVATRLRDPLRVHDDAYVRDDLNDSEDDAEENNPLPLPRQQK